MFAKDFWEPAVMTKMTAIFATTVLRAFEDAGLVTDAEVGAAGGPSTTWMTSLRKATDPDITIAEPRSDTMRRIEIAAGWGPGFARKLFRDGVLPDPESPEAQRAAHNLQVEEYNRRVREERNVRVHGPVMAGRGELTLGGRIGQLPPIAVADLDAVFNDLIIELRLLKQRVAGIEATLDVMLGGPPRTDAEDQVDQIDRDEITRQLDEERAQLLSAGSYRHGVAVAADEQEQSIAGEQEQRQEP